MAEKWKWQEQWDKNYTPEGKFIPKLLTGRYVDLPCTLEEIAVIARMAPPEKKPEKRPRKQPAGSVNERARKYLERKELAVSGQHGHDKTFAAACDLVLGFDLSPEDAFPLLMEYNDRLDERWSESEIEHKLADADKRSGERGWLADSSPIEVREVIPLDYGACTFLPMDEKIPPLDSAFPPSEDCPLVDPEDPLTSIGFSTLPDGSSAHEEKPLATVAMNWLSARVQEGRTDIANGKRLAKLIHGRARYIPAWDSWIVWDGKRWQMDNLGVYELAKQIPATILADSMSPLPVDVPACQWGMKSTSRAALSSMIQLARSEPGVTISHTEIDSDPWLLNCQNGIVDLRTGVLSPHDPSKLITRITNVDYDPDAESFEWDRFLEKILVKDDLIAHVQRLIGYCITGSTREQILPIFWGGGSNGKSTLLDTLKSALGTEYASTSPPSLIMEKKTPPHPCELANLHGKRMVTAIESEKNQKMNEPLVKQLTGGDSIMARRVYENFWEFRPTHKIILCTNHEPKVGDDYAIWRRLVMIPFVVQFWNPDEGESGPEELRRDNTLAGRLEKCLRGVLAWAVRGSQEWFKQGLGRTEDVKLATAEYRKRQDVFGRFVEDVCLTGPSYCVRFSQLYGHFKDWAKESGEYELSDTRFGAWLKSQKNTDGTPKFVHKRSNGSWYSGITWKPEYDKENTFE